MTRPISALKSRPEDLIREVTPDAITYYADELSGLFLPEDFVSDHKDNTDVMRWNSRDRLRGKFGRFTITGVKQQDQEFDDVLLMGTTIGVHAIDMDGYLTSLRHYAFLGLVSEIIEKRDINPRDVHTRAADYGSTILAADQDGQIQQILVRGRSIDFGRAGVDGRQKTCELFDKQLAGTLIAVANSDPIPRQYEIVI